ncbi:E3 ubiquitin-protein ligase TRIM39-like [Sinocyclocheilus rhinocerous]|uniref:E3 ubiquitin-protein ligase TRIM39-like n=1 Tax=Sinocyclocheilus rhinocerous TaxID=307959 RepID=UPI0007BA0721|nr:PREDICTED: E3 ubiquitin-protein ligase TRIM39-like [Sinocyclocheilus rhinocerous]
MASSSGPLNEELQCSICLDVFTDPVTTPCGHNFCRTCLNKFWTNTQTCFCPSCKVTFSKRTDLMINTNRGTIMGGKVTMIQRALKNTDVQQMIQNKMKKIQEIQHSVELRKRNTEKEKSASVELFTDLSRSIERCQSELLKMMEEQQKAAEKQAEDLIKELQQEITDLKKRNSELEQISHTDDHLHLLQMYSSLYSRPHIKNWTEISIDTDVNVLPLHRALTQLKKTHKALNKKLSKSGLGWAQKYAVDVTLDPDTVNPYLILSDDGKQVRHGDIKQDVPENPKRFDDYCVLAKQGFSSGRFYYEVQVKGKTGWSLGVARESINRMGDISPSPEDGLWSMVLINRRQYIACDNPAAAFSHRTTPEIVGVFVDYEEGLVSFYDVGSSSHIYSFTGQTFTDKLYPYFGPGLNDKGKNSNPLIISPRGAASK